MLKLMIGDTEIRPGDTVETFRGETATLISATIPHKPGSTGRVVVRFEGEDENEFFPGVIGATWKEV
jgi:hypothetical protein